MQKTISKIFYIRKKERKSMLFIISILLFSSFSDDLYFAISAKSQDIINLEIITLSEKKLKTKQPKSKSQYANIDATSFNLLEEKVHKNNSINSPASDSTRQILQEHKLPKVPAITVDKQARAFLSIDPNLATKDELVQLGVPEFAANNWTKYVAAGAKIQSKKDLQKIYGLELDIIEKINMKIRYPAKESKYQKPPLMVFDINTANAYEFSAIPGIGKILSERIIKFRDKLGGFHDQAQLKQVYGIVDSVIDNHMQYLEIGEGVSKININAADLVSLSAHPYCNRKAAEILINYRKQHGAFTRPEDLLEIRAFDKEWVSKISPYLTF